MSKRQFHDPHITMIREAMFVIAVPDLDASASFYRDCLGFEIHDMPDSGWRMFTSGACRIMAGECPDAMPAEDLGDHSYFGYLVVDDARKYFERVEAYSAEVVKPVRDEPWGMREFGIRTMDGHRIMIGQHIE